MPARKENHQIDEEIEFLKTLNHRNWSEKVIERVMELETLKLVNTERNNHMFEGGEI